LTGQRELQQLEREKFMTATQIATQRYQHYLEQKQIEALNQLKSAMSSLASAIYSM